MRSVALIATSLLLLFALLLAGCSSTAPVTPSTELRPPVSWAMVPAEVLPAPQEGEDAKELLGRCRVAYGYETAKLAPLQGFAKRVTRKPKS